MSWQLEILNFSLKHGQQPRMHAMDVEDVPEVRARLDWSAKWFVPTPRDVEIAETKLGDLSAQEALFQSDSKTTLLYFHGGGYFMGSPQSHAKLAGSIIQRAGIGRALLPEYRLAPDHPFPAALDDAMASYKALLNSGTHPENIALAGDSAGGGLTLALLAQICAENLPKPAALLAFSPWTDLSLSGASLETNRETEVLLPADRLAETAAGYLGETNPKHPGASPLFARFKGASPVLIQASTAEIFLDDARRMAARLKEDGVSTELQLSDGVPHVWQYFHNTLPEGSDALDAAAAFLRAHLPTG